MNQTILKPGKLLDEQGNLIEAGYATNLVKNYHRSDIQVKGMRIKEWDYYYVGNDHYGIAFTVADNSYMWLTSVTFFDFINKSEKTQTTMGWFPLGKLGMPESSETGDVIFKNDQMSFEFVIKNQKRYLNVWIKDFKKEEFRAEIILEPITKHSMVIATPFNKPKHFYYNQKINLLKSGGYVSIGQKKYPFHDAYGVLDWGRGVWTYKNTWYWSSLSGFYQGHHIGFNLGYGFGDTSKATENMMFYDQHVFKLDDVIFDIPQKNGKDDYMSTWKIYSSKKDIDLSFEPILDRHSHSNVLIISSNQHQVFGKFSGFLAINEKEKIEIHDMIGFAEKVMNRW